LFPRSGDEVASEPPGNADAVSLAASVRALAAKGDTPEAIAEALRLSVGFVRGVLGLGEES